MPPRSAGVDDNEIVPQSSRSDDRAASIHPVTTTQALEHALEDRILDGDLAPGAHLREQDLAAGYDVARHSLRAACDALARRGLLVKRVNRGFFVPQLTEHDAAEIFELRRALEAPVVRDLAARSQIPPATRQALATFQALPDHAPWRDIVRTDVDFHAGLVQAAGNARLTRAHADLLAEIALCIVQTGQTYDTPRRSPASTRRWSRRSSPAAPTAPSASWTPTSPRASSDCRFRSDEGPRAARTAERRAVRHDRHGAGTRARRHDAADGRGRAHRRRRRGAGRRRAAAGKLRDGIRWAPGPALAGGLGVVGYQLCFFAAVDSTGVALGTVVALGSGPAFAGLLGLVLHREPLTRRWALPPHSPPPARRCSCWRAAAARTSTRRASCSRWARAPRTALYTVTSKTLLEDGHSPEGVMAVAFGLGAILLAPVLVTGDTAWLSTPGGAALAIYLGSSRRRSPTSCSPAACRSCPRPAWRR